MRCKRLTQRNYYLYSVAMHAELSALEDKVRQLIALCAALRHDNRALREQLLTADRANKRLATQMTEAAQRLDVVLARLPGDGK